MGANQTENQLQNQSQNALYIDPVLTQYLQKNCNLFKDADLIQQLWLNREHNLHLWM